MFALAVLLGDRPLRTAAEGALRTQREQTGAVSVEAGQAYALQWQQVHQAVAAAAGGMRLVAGDPDAVTVAATRVAVGSSAASASPPADATEILLPLPSDAISFKLRPAGGWFVSPLFGVSTVMPWVAALAMGFGTFWMLRHRGQLAVSLIPGRHWHPFALSRSCC